MCSTGGGISSLSPSSRDAVVDPIAELLSQLSGVRRGAGQPGTPSQLQQLQMQLQLERQQATVTPPLLSQTHNTYMVLICIVCNTILIEYFAVSESIINWCRRLGSNWSGCRAGRRHHLRQAAPPQCRRPRRSPHSNPRHHRNQRNPNFYFLVS